MNELVKENSSFKATMKKIVRIIFERILPISFFIILILRVLSANLIIPNDVTTLVNDLMVTKDISFLKALKEVIVQASDATLTIRDYVGLASSPLQYYISNGYEKITIVVLVAIWLQYVANIAVIISPFFKFRVAKNIGKWLFPIYILNLLLIGYVVILFQGSANFTLFYLFYFLEIVFGLILCLYNFISDGLPRWNLKGLLYTVLAFVLMLIPAFPSYTMQFIFGYTNPLIKIVDFTATHRIFIYLAFIVPVVLYFVLRGKKQEVIRYTLLYISTVTMVCFLSSYYSVDFVDSPGTIPIHLCNTAMFIIPICLAFKTRRLFYFTYFINVLGALLAMLMPNYGSANLYENVIYKFWYNHWIAFWMPLLIVALKEFERPKLKEFIWSMVWFLGYFVIALFLNVYFTSKGHSADFFFLNGDHIVGILGKWAEDIFKMTWSVNFNNTVLEFRPLYQSLFFLVYVVLGLCVWFVYGLFFRIADDHYALHLRLKQMREDKKKDALSKQALNKNNNVSVLKKIRVIDREEKSMKKKYKIVKMINRKINKAQSKQQATEILRKNWLQAFTVAWTAIAICLLSSIFAGRITGLLFTSLFAISVYKIYIEAYNTKKYNLLAILDIFDQYTGRRINIAFRKCLYLFGWTLLFWPIAIIKFYSYYLAEFISIKYPEKTAKECISESRELMNGHKFELFTFHLSFIGWILLSIMSAGFGFIWTLPYFVQSTIVYIDQYIYNFSPEGDGITVVQKDEMAFNEELMARRNEVINGSHEAKLELIHFSKKYATSKVYAVEDANLEVHAGEIFGFLGPNGAGKSTIIKSLVGIQPITEGFMEICGYDVQTDSVNAKYNLGFVPDHYALYEKLTGREYINYIADIYGVSKEERDARLNKYVEIFELAHSIDSKIRTYSHGMKQKITIMAALVHNPKVWILDEPLTGLDPNSIYQVKECMKQHAKEGNIVFFSSHIIDIVEKLCGRIAIIKKGKIQCVKTIKEIEESGYTLEQFYLETISDKKE